MTLVDEWAAQYASAHPLYKEAAELARKLVEDELKGLIHGVHEVQARAKSVDSAYEKVARNKYLNPADDLDDLVGVRVLLLHDSCVKDAVQRLRSAFAVDEKRSKDKTALLAPHEVGYRSSHLAIRMQPSAVSDAATLLRSTIVEVQVRSLLSHAWAEVEHSLRYKAGEGLPPAVSRHFDTLAGTLELADWAFSQVEAELGAHVNYLAGLYGAGLKCDDKLSSVQLLATLKSERPNMRSAPGGLKLEIEDAFRVAKILEDVGVSSVGDLQSALRSSDVLSDIRAYVDAVSIEMIPEQASALVVLGSVIARRDLDRYHRVQLFNADLQLNAVLDASCTPGAPGLEVDEDGEVPAESTSGQPA